MPHFDKPLVLVGAGKMGGALLTGWLNGRDGQNPVLGAEQLYLLDPNAPEDISRLVEERGCAMNLSINEIAAVQPRIVVLAVKPQIMGAVLPELRSLVRPGTLFVSIAAGVSLDKLSEMLGGGAAIVRAMPNTPVSVGLGITAAFGNALVTEADRATCDLLLGAVGAVVWLSQESQMDAVTALSGSGPAYVFALTECMAAAGEALGLEPKLAAQLARATVAGSGAMLARSSEDAAVLRKNVTSPGGTTAAALDVLMGAEGLSLLMRQAMTAARARSRELAK